ncbi:Non-heme 11 kDa protein of cytochrome bc1 complex [Hymenopellis radicata]|nr:Non-heme 11 kDa protein of cytochrome bc1 complex [Hymenopellis radicata]
MSITDFFSSFLPTVHAEEEKAEEEAEAPQEEAKEEAAEEEEEEPEDIHPVIRDECRESSKCKESAKHFSHCTSKVEAGQGFKGEDCVEELFHMMHCVEDCAAPKLFAKLK